METQVESLKSTGEIVQSSHIHWHFSEQKGYFGPAHAWLCACIQPTKGDTDGGKCVKPMIRLYCPCPYNVGLPGKRGEEPGLWFLLERRAEFSYNRLCSIVSITHTLCTGAGPEKGCLGAWWQPSLQHLVCSTAGARGFGRAEPRLCEALVTQWEQQLSLTQG